jgi:hypothetical protein
MPIARFGFIFFLLEEIVVFCAVFCASLPTIADAVSRGEEGEGPLSGNDREQKN